MSECQHTGDCVIGIHTKHREFDVLMAEIYQDGTLKLIGLTYWWQAQRTGDITTGEMSFLCDKCKYCEWYIPYTEAPPEILEKFERVQKAYKELEPCPHAHIRRIFLSEEVNYSVEINDEEEIDDISRDDQKELIRIGIICDDCAGEVTYENYYEAPENVVKLVEETFKRLRYRY